MSLLIIVNGIAFSFDLTGEVSQENFFVDLLLSEMILKPGNKEGWLLIQVNKILAFELRKFFSCNLKSSIILCEEILFRNFSFFLFIVLSSGSTTLFLFHG
jgi:hypothetical protein